MFSFVPPPPSLIGQVTTSVNVVTLNDDAGELNVFGLAGEECVELDLQSTITSPASNHFMFLGEVHTVQAALPLETWYATLVPNSLPIAPTRSVLWGSFTSRGCIRA